VTVVTIYTDASIYRGVGSWATVILRAGNDLVELSGKLRGSFQSSTAVEGAAIANALWHARRAGLIEPGDDVTVRSDNLSIVQRIAQARAGFPWRDARDPDIMRAVESVLTTVGAVDVQVRFRWVKGHQRLDSDDPHMIYNRRCDDLAGAARKGERVTGFDVLVAKVAAARARRAAGQGSRVERELWAREAQA